MPQATIKLGSSQPKDTIAIFNQGYTLPASVPFSDIPQPNMGSLLAGVNGLDDVEHGPRWPSPAGNTIRCQCFPRFSSASARPKCGSSIRNGGRGAEYDGGLPGEDGSTGCEWPACRGPTIREQGCKAQRWRSTRPRCGEIRRLDDLGMDHRLTAKAIA